LKKIQVQMSDECHAVLKDYANAWGLTMSEVMYEAARCLIHKSSNDCPFVDYLFKFRQIKQDKRLTKECYGHKCFACKFSTACRTGFYQGEFELSEQSSALFAGVASKV
jgi:hypothetical protein